jgi:hypothetical protein
VIARFAVGVLASFALFAQPVSAAEHEAGVKNIEKVVSCKGAKTSDWNAWNDVMPPKPDHFHITGKVEVAHAGITPALRERVPQGIDPAVIILDLMLHEKSGPSIPTVQVKDVRLDKELAAGQKYSKASIHCEGEELASLPVGDVQ